MTAFTPEYLKTHQFTPDEVNGKHGYAIAYLAKKHGNHTAMAALDRVNLDARHQREREQADAQATLAAQQQDGVE